MFISPKNWSEQITMLFLRCASDACETCGTKKKGVHKKIAVALDEALVTVSNEMSVTDDEIHYKYDGMEKQWSVWSSLCKKTDAL